VKQAEAGGRQGQPPESGGTRPPRRREGPTGSPPPSRPFFPGKTGGGQRTIGAGRLIDHRRSRASCGASRTTVANRATSGLKRSPPRGTDRHRGDQDKRLGIVRGKEGTTDVPMAEGREANRIGRVGTGGVGRDVARQRRDEGNTATGRAVAVGQTRGVVGPRGHRFPHLTVGTKGLRRLGQVVASQPIATTRLGSAAPKEHNGKRSQDTHDGDHEGS